MYKVYSRELDHMIMEAGKSKMHLGKPPFGDPGKRLMQQSQDGLLVANFQLLSGNLKFVLCLGL